MESCTRLGAAILVFAALASVIRCANSPLQFHIPEGLPVGTEIGRIPVRPLSRYQLTTFHEFFTLNPSTGQIFLKQKLDREKLIREKFELVIVDQTQSGFPTVVQVVVTDVNDNAPSFGQNSVSITFLETEQIGQRVLLDPAVDKDNVLHGVIRRYAIVSGNEDGKFRLTVTEPNSDNPKHHFLHLENTAILDRETHANYLLNISATDNGNPSLQGFVLLNVTIGDLNDCSPVFDPSEYAVALNENAAANSLVLKVHATDNDDAGTPNSRIIYSLTNSSQFTVDQSGVIRTTRNKTHCPRNKCQHSDCPRTCVLTVEGRDCGEPFLTGRAYVYITLMDENDHAPEITFRYYPSNYEYATVAEDAVNGTVVAVVSVRDLDDGVNGQVSLSITGGNIANQFRMDAVQHSTSSSSSLQLAYLKVNGQFDRRRMSTLERSWFNLSITAVDAGHPSLNSSKSLIVIVNDVNDHAPVFQSAKYLSELNEVAPVGSFVQAVHAIDADGAGINGKILYSIVDGNAFGWFHVNQDTGLVTTSKPLDHQLTSLINLNISARDSAPSPRIAYTLLSVLIEDANDHAPRFVDCPREVILRENVPTGTLVHQFSAADEDAGSNGLLSYRLLHKSELSTIRDGELFTLDAQSGRLTTRGQLDREQQAVFNLLLIARDDGRPSQSTSCSVTVKLTDENDNRPVFYPIYYTIPTDNTLPAGHKITRVKATDADEARGIRYAIGHSSHNGIIVDELSGGISTSTELFLSQGDLIKVQITAHDAGGLSAATPATVYLFAKRSPSFLEEFVFEKSAGYSFSVQENTPPPFTVGVIKLLRHETWTGVEYFLSEGDPAGVFSISPLTGLLQITKPVDHEKSTSYRLKIAAWKSPYFASTTIDIIVRDVNDNAPVITNLQGDDASLDIPLSWPLGKTIIRIAANDADSAEVNGQLSFSLLNNSLVDTFDKQAPFAVNSTTGSLYLRHPLNPQTETATITIRVTDQGNLSSQQQVHFRFRQDHCPLSFLKSRSSLAVPENRAINSRLMTFNLRPCPQTTRRVSFKIPYGNEDGRFGVFPDGQLYVNATLNHDQTAYYMLRVTAADEQQTASAAVMIHITDSNNHAPQFLNQTYRFIVDENLPMDSFIGHVQAVDGDFGLNGEISYRINNTDLFSIESQTGILRTRGTFDRETLRESSTMYLEVTAVDRSSQSPLSSTVLVQVSIRDQNDNWPVFTQQVYEQSVSERMPPGERVAEIKAVDVDLTANGQVMYSIKCPGCHQVFAVDSLTGLIRLNQSLDYEMRSRYDLVIFATDQAVDHTARHTSTAILIVRVLDENDQAPRFLHAPYAVTVSERTPAGSFITQAVAIDTDTVPSETIYTISAGNPDKIFRINRFGQIYLNYPLDYEKSKEHNLTVAVLEQDAQHLFSKTWVYVRVEDANDNAPLFSDFIKSTIHISEDISPGSVVATTLAHDEDSGANGEIRYTILYTEPASGSGYFDIHEVTGQITTKAQLDREHHKSYRLVLQATDQAEPHSARQSTEKAITILLDDINDHAPYFTNPRVVVVPEYANSGYRLLTVSAVDPDLDKNGHVTYDLTRTADMERFHLDRYDGHVYLRGGLQQITPHYTLTVLARDQSNERKQSSTMNVDLVIASRVNSDTVTFSQSAYQWNVFENATIGLTIGTVSATSSEPVEYFLTSVTSLSGDVVPCVFDVDQHSGSVVVKGQLDADQGTSGYIIQIYAGVKRFSSYQVAASQVQLTILPVNDNAPVFSSPFYRFRLDGNAEIGFRLGQVAASDVDRSDIITYTLDGSPDSTFLRINHETGELYLKSFPQNSTQLCFSVLADDSLHRSEVTCCIQVEDPLILVPQFTKSPYVFTVVIDSLEDGEQVGAITAFGDGGQYEFYQTPDWFDGLLQIDRRSGAVFITESRFFKNPDNGDKTIVLQVEAAAAAYPTLSNSTRVYINLLHKMSTRKVIQIGEILVPEDAVVGTCIADVFAYRYPVGRDDSEPYWLKVGDPFAFFDITADGLVCVATKLDRESHPSFNLSITFQSGFYHTEYILTVTVNDVNDEAPKFVDLPSTVTISRNDPVGSEVLKVRAVDRDSGPGGEVQYMLESHDNEFSLDAFSGTVRINEKLSTALKSLFRLNVTAYDKGTPSFSSSATVNILIREENNHAPRFSSSNYKSQLSENVSVGFHVLTVSAIDGDSGLNGDLRYWIMSGNDEEVFELEVSSGQLFTARPLDYEQNTSYKLLIMVEDSGSPSRNDSATIKVDVVNFNDEAPRFISDTWNVSVMENFFHFPATRILQVRAQDTDAPPFNNILYVMRSGDSSVFRIDEKHGWISILKALDREEQEVYQVEVEARHAGSHVSSVAVIRVTVVDDNDNVPIFTDIFRFTVKENSKVGTFVGYVKATDYDENTGFTYSVVNSTTFAVDERSGRITTVGEMDRERAYDYVLVVKADDGKYSAITTVYITVSDEDDNYPIFPVAYALRNVPELAPEGYFVYGASANDVDFNANFSLRYRFVGISEFYRINGKTGVITVISAKKTKTVQLIIQAFDPANHVVTMILDVVSSDNMQMFPQFVSGPRNFTLIESSRPTSLATFRAKVQTRSVVYYRLASGDISGSFHVNNITGELRLTGQLDFETISLYSLWIEAFSEIENKIFATPLQLIVAVGNENDNAPKFSQELYNAEVDEETAPFDVICVKAIDLDGNSLTYSLRNGTEFFTIDSKTGQVRGLTKLDRETTPFVFIQVAASDELLANTAIVRITVRDKNDNPPKFTRQFTANITENTPIGSVVLRVSSVDLDSHPNAKAEYDLVDSVNGMFSIQRHSGIIRVAGLIDREVHSEILLEMVVRDGSWQSRSLIVITVMPENDNSPVFSESEYLFFLREQTTFPTFVGQVSATDKDEDDRPMEMAYHLRHPHGFFTVDRKTGIVTTKRPLSFSTVPDNNVHELTVSVHEESEIGRSAEASIRIIVLPNNAVVPQFVQPIFHVDLFRGVPAESPVMQLKLRSSPVANAVPKFRIVNANGSDCFTVDPQSGVILTTYSFSNCSFSYYALQAVASYGQETGMTGCNVTIHVTDESVFVPRFSASLYEVDSSERMAVGSVIITVAVEESSVSPGQVQYSLTNYTSHFQIDSSTGAVRLKKQLDYEETPRYEITVVASSASLESSPVKTTIIVSVINENDNPPVFETPIYYATVMETDKLNQQIAIVQTVDIDDPTQSNYYTIEPDSVYFMVDSTKGIITNIKELDYETAQNHSLTVRALDPADPSLFSETTVFVAIIGRNEYVPTCSPGLSVFSVSAMAPAGTKIGKIMATDEDKGLDGVVQYELVGRSLDFAVNRSTGEVSLTRDLASQVGTEHRLHVLLRVLGEIGDGRVICDAAVHVVDGKYTPYFTQREYFARIREDVPPGTSVLTVTAMTELKHKLRYTLTSGDDKGQFSIDSRLGEIKIVRRLDRETTAAYSLEILASVSESGKTLSSVSTVHVVVEDVNDNPPFFDPPLPVGHVKENSNYEMAVMKLNATDKDLGPYFLTYRLSGSEWKDYFKVNPSSGVITAVKALDREKTPEILLKIAVTDSASAPQTALLDVKVIVDDINDNPSVERPLNIVVYMDANSVVKNHRIGNVKPLDADERGNYRCEIIGGSQTAFVIDEGCDLLANDMKAGDIYRLDVQGSDGKHPPVQYQVVIKSELVTKKQHLTNSIALLMSGISTEVFLEKHYIRLMQSMFPVLQNYGQAVVFGLTNVGQDCAVQLAVGINSTFIEKSRVVALLQSKKDDLQVHSGLRIEEFDYKPCRAKALCSATTVCEDVIQMLPHQISITSSSNLIIVAPHFEYSHHCSCPEPFSGPQCELQCLPDMCQNGGTCVNNGKCLCPAGFYGSQCQFDLDECNLWGLPNCYNGGKCVNTFGSFRCECPAMFTGKQCEEPRQCTDSSCGALSNRYGFSAEAYMELGPMDGVSSQISFILSTVMSDAMLAFTQGAVKNGVADFMALEILKGKPFFVFGSNARDTTRITVNKVISDGKWYRIDVLKEDSLGTLTVSDCDDASCVACPAGDETCSTLAVGVVKKQHFGKNSLYIGGLPTEVLVDESRLRSRHFLGCIRNLVVKNSVVTTPDIRTSQGVSDDSCPVLNDICRFGPCSSNEICVNAQDGHFDCVVAESATNQMILVLVLVIVLLIAALLVAIVYFRLRKPCRRLKKTGSSNYGRSPFLSPVNLFEQGYIPGTYQQRPSKRMPLHGTTDNVYDDNFCSYHASQRNSCHYYCVVPEKPERPASHYASSCIYEARHSYVNDANITAMRGRHAVISPSAVSEEPQSSVSTQPADIVSLDSVDSGNEHFHRRQSTGRNNNSLVQKGDFSDACSDCENCKVPNIRYHYETDWTDVSRFREQPTYAEVDEINARGGSLLQVTV